MQIDQLFNEAQRLHQCGKLTEAKKCYEKILKRKPDFGQARLFLALILQQTGQSLSAVENAKRAMQDIVSPEAGVWANYGIILKNAGLLEEAEKAYREALVLQPDLLAAKANLGTVSLLTGKIDAAERLFLELTETLEEVGPWLNLARIALTRDDRKRVTECLERAEDISPKHPDIPFLRAMLFSREADDSACFAQIRNTLHLQPAHAEAWALLLRLDPEVLDFEFLEEAATALAKSNVQQASLLTTAVDLCRKYFLWSPLETLEALLKKTLEHPLDKSPGLSACFTVLAANIPQYEHLKVTTATWNNLFCGYKELPQRILSPRHSDIPIRVGFLSADFRNHATSFLVAGLFDLLPHKNIEWIAYNNSFSDASAWRNRLRASMDLLKNHVVMGAG